MEIVCNEELYAVLSENMGNKVEVYIDSSFIKSRFLYEKGNEKIGTGWAVKSWSGKFIGFGVAKADGWFSNSTVVSELKGMLTFFSMLSRFFPTSYANDTKFIIRCDNLWLIKALNVIQNPYYEDTDEYDDARKKLGRYFSSAKKMVKSYNVGFRWVKGHSTDSFNNLTDSLAYHAYKSDLSSIDYAHQERFEGLQLALEDFRNEMGTNYPSFISPGAELDDMLSTFRVPSVVASSAVWRTVKHRKNYLVIRRTVQSHIDIYVGISLDADNENELTKISAISYMGSSAIMLDKDGVAIGYSSYTMKKKKYEDPRKTEIRAIERTIDEIKKWNSFTQKDTKYIIHSPNKELVDTMNTMEARKAFLVDPEKEFRQKNPYDRMTDIIATCDVEFVWEDENDTTAYRPFLEELASLALSLKDVSVDDIVAARDDVLAEIIDRIPSSLASGFPSPHDK